MTNLLFGLNRVNVWNVIFLVAIVLTFIVAFRVDKKAITTRKIMVAGILSALAIVANMLSVSLFFFGAETVKIGFQLVILISIGITLGPKMAVMTGLVIDMLGLLVRPAAIIFLGFTWTTMLSALIPALIFHYFGNRSNSLLKKKIIVNTFIATLTIISLYYIVTLQEIVTRTETLFVSTSQKIVAIVVLLGLIVLLYGIIFYLEKRIKDNREKIIMFYDNMFVVSVVLFIVSLVLTPFFLYVMYDIPIIMNLLPRIFKDVILLPIYTLMLTLFLPVLLKLSKEM